MAGALRRKRQPVIGVMAVQGDFREHLETLDAIGAVGREIRLPADLDGVDGLILPGGESTAMRKLYARWGLVAPIKALAARGADVSTAGNDGWTPVYVAARNGHAETVSALVKGSGGAPQ